MIRIQVTIPNEEPYSVSSLRLPCTLGRSRKCDLMVRHPSVSGEHATLFERDGKVWIKDLGSRNGIRVATGLQDEIQLREGSSFDVGDIRCRVESLTIPTEQSF
ncbi:MAG: FHA domain-containing protein, partial [Proteobacteria bacterium]